MPRVLGPITFEKALEQARADGYAAGAMAERGHQRRAVGRSEVGAGALLGFAIGFVAAVLVAIVLSECTAHAQHEPDELLLARTCVSERGWRLDTDDCAAFADVARSRVERRGGTLGDAIRALAPRLHSRAITRRLWLLDLDLDAHRPDGLVGASWDRPLEYTGGLSRRDAWLATLAEARAILAGEIPSPCIEQPHAWGSDGDLSRRRARGYLWRDAECPGATFVNNFGFLYRPEGE